MKLITDLPDPWAVYARLQAELDRRKQVDDRSCGLEAGLNRLLAMRVQPLTEEAVSRAVRSESRRERHRAQLRRVHLLIGDSVADPEGRALLDRHCEPRNCS